MVNSNDPRCPPQGGHSTIEAIDTLLAEEITVREGRRIKAALQMARLATVKKLTGFDFSFQPSLDRNRIMALASLDFVDKHEVVHLFCWSGLSWVRHVVHARATLRPSRAFSARLQSESG